MTDGAPVLAGRAALPAGEPDPTADSRSPDEALMSAYARGDATAFDVLYARHRGPLYRYFSRQLGEAAAHDCFQTVWMKVIRSRTGYRPDAPFRHYLFTLAHNVLMDHHRSNARQPAATVMDPDELEDGQQEPAGAAEQQELLGHLHRLIRALPTHQREAWLLRQETSFSTADIARVTGTSEEGVKSRLRYARDRLKQGMARYVR